MRRWMLIMAVAGAAGCAVAQNDAPVPASLAGTTVDGDLRIDGQGHLVIDDGTRLLFDYFLTAQGEVSRDDLRILVWREADRRVPEAADEVMALFDRYLQYRDGVARVLQSRPPTVAEAAAEIAAIRARTVGDAPVFAADDQALARAVAMTRAAGDKVARIAGEDLAPSERAVRQRAETVLTLRRAEARATDVYQVRVERVGANAADRLAVLDRHRQQWHRRIAAYREDRARIARTIADPEARQIAVDALIDRRFDAREQRRVRALDRIAGVGDRAP